MCDSTTAAVCLTDDHHNWATNFTGINTCGANGSADPAGTPIGDPSAAATGPSADQTVGAGVATPADSTSGQTTAANLPQASDPNGGNTIAAADSSIPTDAQSARPPAPAPRPSTPSGGGPNEAQSGQAGGLKSGPPAGPAAPDRASDDYKQGYHDGLSGVASNEGPRVDVALASYYKGYAEGAEEAGKVRTDAAAGKQGSDGDNLVAEGAEHVVIHGVVHLAEHFLKIGGGIYTFMVAMTVAMECDTKMWRFKCPTCQEEGPPQCTMEEAQDDEKKHLHDHPDHAIDEDIH